VPDFVRFGAYHLVRYQGGFKIGPVLLATIVCLSLSVDVAQARSRKHVRQAQLNKTALTSPVKVTEPLPKGPLTIVVSIAKQTLTVYDGFEPIATTSVSTGVPGHETPTGIFSIIQKDRFHRSNLYSNAPMPYMQRITWSGVALHEGHVTGRVASHGCVRLPQAFAQRLWGLTKLGARVIIAQDDVSLTEIAAPAVLAARPVPQAQIASGTLPDPRAPTLAAPAQPASVEQTVETAPPLMANLEEPKLNEPVLVSEQKMVSEQVVPNEQVLADATAAIEPTKDQAVASSNLDLGSLSQELEVKLERADIVLAEKPNVDTPNVDKPNLEMPNVEPPTIDKSNVENPIVETVSVETPNIEKPNIETPAAALLANASSTQDLAISDPTKLVEIPPVVTLDPKAGPLAILISKRDGKLMIRQNFKPVYETSVQFEPSQDLLGTHLYSALGSIDTGLRWASMTLPSAQSILMERERLARPAGRKNNKGVQLASRSDMPLPEMFLSADKALQNVRIPDEAVNLIAAALTPGSSLIITDLSQSHETGRGTDFIVQAR